VRRPIILILALIFALALLARAVTYTVRFTEAGVLTTFGKAAEQDLNKVREPGLHFKWPDPIQSVTKYDTRSRFLQTKAEQQQTADSKQITVEAFCTWRVKNPLLFFQRFSNAGDRAEEHYNKAEQVLSANLRSALGEVSKYSMTDLFSTTPGSGRMAELEGKVLAALKTGAQDGGNLADYGIEVTSVGINRIELPEETTKSVFESMKQERKRLVDQIESKGDAESTLITTTARANADRIEAFARAYAEDIRRQGDLEAQQYVSQMNENPELAVFLKQIQFWKELAAARITTVLSPATPGMSLQQPKVSGDGRISSTESLMGADVAGKALAAPQPSPTPVKPVSGQTSGNRQ
jgi:membrane protease subunit HflC